MNNADRHSLTEEHQYTQVCLLLSSLFLYFPLLSSLHIAPVRRESTNLHSHATVYAASRSKLISTQHILARMSLLWEFDIYCGPKNVEWSVWLVCSLHV